MLVIILQILAGVFFTANKVFIAIAEKVAITKKNSEQTWRFYSWVCYLIGVPAWCTIFYFEKNYIAFMTLIAGVPSIIIGILNAKFMHLEKPKWLNHIAVVMIVIGCGISFYELGLFTKITQVYETITSTGYLVGTYMIANKNNKGYLWWLCTHLSTLLLMMEIDKDWLAVQQGITIPIVWYAYQCAKQKI